MAGLKIISGCSRGAEHVLRMNEAEQVLALAARTEQLEVTGRNGERVLVPPLTAVLHGFGGRLD